MHICNKLRFLQHYLEEFISPAHNLVAGVGTVKRHVPALQLVAGRLVLFQVPDQNILGCSNVVGCWFPHRFSSRGVDLKLKKNAFSTGHHRCQVADFSAILLKSSGKNL